ncbi:glucosaminidase domain-containing protein [Rummeliibacillus pycnus]|uniref:glucosaminidase domain-containing protein n=1 Tax=Rummeliibacillus pycnus TaxID=101070 RepID=UPI003D29D67C
MSRTIKTIIMILTFVLSTVFITHGQASAEESESFAKTEVNEIAHIKSKTDKIYKSPDNMDDFVLADTTYTGIAYYAKNKTSINKKTYYQLFQGSKEIGWVLSTDLQRNTRTLLNKTKSTAYIAGTGQAYNMPWGGTKNKVFTLSDYRAKAFKIIRTEKIGTATWHQGTLDGKTVWISAAYVETNPYIALNLRKASDITVNEMRAFLLSKGKLPNNVLYKLAPTFITLQKEAGINAQFMFAHAILETGWGSSTISQYKNNYFGYQAYDTCALTCAKYFPTGKDGLNAYAYKIYRDYLTTTGPYYNGPTLLGMNVKYATDKGWSEKIANLMAQMKPYKSSDYSDKVASTKVFQAPKEYDNVIPEKGAQPEQYRKMPSAISATVDVAEGATVYSLPYIYSAQYGTYKKGKNMTIKAYHTDVRDFKNKSGKTVRWYRIQYSDKQAWVRSDQIAVSNLGFTSDTANLRNGADTKYTQVASVNKNTPVKFVKKDNKYVTKKDKSKTTWYQIYKPGSTKKVWISGKLINMYN